MVLTKEEQEIVYFYRTGSTTKELAEVYDYRPYWIKKLLAAEPEFARIGYVFRSLPSR